MLFASSSGRLLAATVATALVAVVPPSTAAADAPMVRCEPVAVRDAHGGHIRANTSLAPVHAGRVLTLDPETGATAQTRFTGKRWVTATDGTRYAVANQRIARGGRTVLVASPMRPDQRIPCTRRERVTAHAADTASSTADGSLGSGGYLEKAASTANVSGRPIENYATRPVCGSTPAHPDGAPIVSQPRSDMWCFSYRGAGMNDVNGAERYSPAQGGTYIDDPYHRHFIVYNGATVPAAKRPAVYPDCRPVPGSPIAWRPVAKNCNIAN